MTPLPNSLAVCLGQFTFRFDFAQSCAQRRRNIVQKGKMVMQVTTERPDQAALTIDKSASVLGLHEFSLLSRIQAGEIKSARARSGEMVIPEDELERLARTPINTLAVSIQGQETKLSDDRLGIKWRPDGTTRANGERLSYMVPNSDGQFSEGEIKSYRAAFGAIAGEYESLTALKTQLDKPRRVPAPAEKEFSTPEIGRWLVRSSLLNLGQSEILLCQRADYDFAIIERFRDDSVYARANGSAEILMQGNRNRVLGVDNPGGVFFIAGPEAVPLSRLGIEAVIDLSPFAQPILHRHLSA